MLLVIRSRFPRIANVLSFVSGVIFLAIGIAAGASPTVLILGGGSSVLLSAARYLAKRHPRLLTGRGTVSLHANDVRDVIDDLCAGPASLFATSVGALIGRRRAGRAAARGRDRVRL